MIKTLNRHTVYTPLLFALGAAALAFGGCSSGIGEPESKMTSYTANESATDTAQLFTVPPDQMAHIKVVPVEKSRLQRTLRLTGSVAYNQVQDHASFSRDGRAGSRNSRRPWSDSNRRYAAADRE